VKSVRASTARSLPTNAPSRPASTSLTELLVCTEDDVQRIIMSSPTKSCTLDPVPTYLLKESLHILLPYITVMVNTSLHEGHVPVTPKHAIITPLIKKSTPDTSVLKNYRPVSNSTFMSKVIERTVADRLLHYLHKHDLLPHRQLAYQRHHSTETAFLRVLSDIYAGRKSLCSVYSTSVPPSTASTMTFCCDVCASPSALAALPWHGSNHSCAAVPSR